MKRILNVVTNVVEKAADVVITSLEATNNLANATEKVTRIADTGAEIYLEETTHELELQRAKFKAKLQEEQPVKL